jgi:hypothetical protein
MANLAPIVPYIMAAGTAISGVAGLQASQYQAAVAENNAKLLAQQAERETLAANQDIQDQDTAARGEIAALMASMDASGIRSDTGTMLLRRSSAEQLALRDRELLGQKRDISLENTKRQEVGSRMEARATRSAGKLGLLSTMVQIPTSYLSGASMVNNYNRGRLTLSSPSYARG